MTLTPEQTLHERSTRGEQLNAAEQTQLDRWYAQLDRQEAQALWGQAEPPLAIHAVPARLPLLKEQVDDLLEQLNVATQRWQELSAQNKVLRRENAILRLKIAQHGSAEAP